MAGAERLIISIARAARPVPFAHFQYSRCCGHAMFIDQIIQPNLSIHIKLLLLVGSRVGYLKFSENL